MMQDFKISVVVPAFNEEGNVRALWCRLAEVMGRYPTWEIIFVDDGSTDGTLERIRELEAIDKRVKWISLSRNFGHQNALKAGLDHASGDCVISIDCDLQHPVELIPEMITHWIGGYDIVFTIREEDPSLPFLKRMTARLFYKVANAICDVEIRQGTADFRLLDKRVVSILRNLPENFLFFRGLVPWLGFRQAAIKYFPRSRNWGESKYSVRRMVALALDGIMSFSIRPLRISTLLGLACSTFAFFYGMYAVAMKLLTDQAIEGWASVIVSVLFIGGVQLIVLGIIGEYIGKTFIQTKSRPNYLVKDKSRTL